MPSHTIPTDNGKYDQLITITLEGCTVTARENDGRDGSGASIWCETHEFTTESEAQAYYEAQIRKYDPQHFARLEATARAAANAIPVYLEFHDRNSHKFYEVTVIESTVNVRYGRVGTQGKTFSDSYISAEQAQAAADKKLNEKLKKGYSRPNPPDPAPAADSASVPSLLKAIDATTPTVLAVIVASSLDRLLWFVLSEMQGYLRPDGEFKDEDELEESEYDDERSWYDDPDYCLQHDPDIVTFH